MTEQATMPVDPAPTGLYDDRRELWYCCTGIINSHETADDLKQMALGIRQQLRLEARVNELTELFYMVKEQRDRFLGFCRIVCPEHPKGTAVWDHEVGAMFLELMTADRQRLRDLLDECEKFCPVWMQDKIRESRKVAPPTHPSRLIEALKAIADHEHCLTRHTVQGLRDIAMAALQEIDPKNDYSSCTDQASQNNLRDGTAAPGFAQKQ